MLGTEHVIKQVIAALDMIVSGMEQLRTLGVLRSRKLASDFSEWLVAQIYEGELAQSKTQKGWDVRATNEKIQVKVSFKPDDPANRWCYVGIQQDFDSLVLLVLSDSFKVAELYKIPHAELLPLLKPDKQSPRLNWNDLKPWWVSVKELKTYARLSDLFD